MDQTATIATTNIAQPVDLEALRLKLEEDREYYCEILDSREGHDRLLRTLQTNNCREIITAVVDEDDLASAFVQAAFRDDVDIVEAFLHHEMNVNIKDENDYTALMYASGSARENCARLLLDHGADVDIQDGRGFTALMHASQQGHTKSVEMLLEKNANPNVQEKSGRTALMFSSARGDKQAVQLLLSHGADTELKNNDGKTALDLALTEETKELLLNHVTASYLLK